jgi:hypothetical protein
MNCRDECAGLCLLRRFSEEVADQWIRPTEQNFLSEHKGQQGRELIYEMSGLGLYLNQFHPTYDNHR